MTWAAAHTAFLFLRVQEKEAKEYTLRCSPAGTLHLYRQQADGPKLANAQTAVHLYRLLPATFRLRHEGDWGASANLGRHMSLPLHSTSFPRSRVGMHIGYPDHREDLDHPPFRYAPFPPIS